MKTVSKVDKFVIEGKIIGMSCINSMEGINEYTAEVYDTTTNIIFYLPVNKNFISEFRQGTQIKMEIKVSQ